MTSTPPPADQVIWSRGTTGSSDLPEHLFQVSRTAAHSVLKYWQSYDAEELLWAAVSVGLSVETCLKLALALVNPVLLADKGSKHGTYLLLAGISDGTTTPQTAYTIGAAEAALRVRSIPNTAIKIVDCEQVFGVRNSAAHMGIVTRTDLTLAARNMVSVIEGLLPALGRSSSDFWGAYSSLTSKMLSEKSTELQQRIETKKLASFQYFEQLKSTVDSNQLENLLATLELSTQSKLFGVEVVEQVCPVCGRSGYMNRRIIGINDISGSEDVDDRPERFSYRYAYPLAFDCPVCRVHFDEEESGEVDQFEQEVEIPPDEWTTQDQNDSDWENLSDNF